MDLEKSWGPYAAVVVKRENDPPPSEDPTTAQVKTLGRVKFKIAGEMEDSAWAFPRNFGGSKKWGHNAVPPIGSDILVSFVNGRRDFPVWEPAHHGEDETFPEFEHPDVAVWGIGPFRLVIDPRDNGGYMALRVVKEVNGVEDVICELMFNAKENGVRLLAGAALSIESDGQLNVKAKGDCEIQGRKILPANRAI